MQIVKIALHTNEERSSRVGKRLRRYRQPGVNTLLPFQSTVGLRLEHILYMLSAQIWKCVIHNPHGNDKLQFDRPHSTHGNATDMPMLSVFIPCKSINLASEIMLVRLN